MRNGPAGDVVTSLRSLMDSYHGPHVAALLPNAEVVEWRPSLPRVHRVRIRAHTCSCRFPIYEFCTGGGLSFVRRLAEEDPAVGVESPWVKARAAQELWLRILSGTAG